jgi:GNAT superfamily N-acetyltransferase
MGNCRSLPLPLIQRVKCQWVPKFSSGIFRQFLPMYKEAFCLSLTTDQIYRLIIRHEVEKWLIICDDKKLIGFLCVSKCKDGLLVSDLVVRPDCRGQGLTAIIWLLVQNETQGCTLHINVDNNKPRLVDAYCRWGFKLVGRKLDGQYELIYQPDSVKNFTCK